MSSTGVSRIEGVDPSVAIKAPCRVATTQNIVLSGSQTLDGILVQETTPKTRVLVWFQLDAAQNGIYDVYDTAWQRSDDFNGSRDVVDGTLVSVDSGNSFSGKLFSLIGLDPIIPGSSAIHFGIIESSVNVIGNMTTIANFAALSSVVLGVGQQVNILGHTIAGLGGGTFQGFSGNIVSDGGLVSPTSVPGFHAKRVYYENIIPEMFGLLGDGSSNDSIALELAAAATNTIKIDRNTIASSTLMQEVVDVTFRGKGKISNIYHRQVIPDQSAADEYEYKDLVPGKHLIAANRAAKPTVVFMGDSIATHLANSIARSDMLTEVLRTALNEKFPNGVNFYNRAIGGKAYGDLLAVQYQSYIPWYAGLTTKNWIDIAKDLTPDLLILSFGMNDNSNVRMIDIKATIDYIQGWTKVPSIVICTNLVPSPSSIAFPEGESGQISRDKSAGAIRSYAKFRGLGLIDVHRKHCMVRDGYDPVLSCMTITPGYPLGDTVVSVVNGAAHTSIGTKKIIDFKARVQFDAAAFSGVQYLTIKTGSGANDFLQILKPSGTTLTFNVYAGGVDSIGAISETINYTLPSTTAYHFVVERSNGWLVVYNDTDTQLGAFNEPIWTNRCISLGSEYIPRVDGNAGFVLKAVDFSYGEQRKNVPSMTTSLLWGNEATIIGNIAEHGGSGYNHPGGFAKTHIYAPLIYGADWVVPVRQKGVTAIAAGLTTLTVTLPIPELNSNYLVSTDTEGNDIGVRWRVTAKTTTNFTVTFSAATVGACSLVWEILR